MAHLSAYSEDAILNHLLKNTPMPSPTDVYLALHGADPTNAGTSNEIATPRQLLALGTVANGEVSNTADIDFANLPQTSVTHVTVKDALTGGNTLFWGPLDNPAQADAGATYRITAGQLVLRLE